MRPSCRHCTIRPALVTDADTPLKEWWLCENCAIRKAMALLVGMGAD